MVRLTKLRLNQILSCIDSVVVGIDDHLATCYVKGALTLYAFALWAGNIERSALDIDISAILILVVGGLTSRAVAVKLALYAFVAHSADVDLATLHQEVLVTRNAIANGRCHIDSGILYSDVVACLDGMFHIANNVQRTLLCKLGMPLDVETG